MFALSLSLSLTHALLWYARRAKNGEKERERERETFKERQKVKVVEENDLLAEKQESQNRDVPRKKKELEHYVSLIRGSKNDPCAAYQLSPLINFQLATSNFWTHTKLFALTSSSS